MSAKIQSLKPLNDEVSNVVVAKTTEETNVINLDLCQWRYSIDAAKAYNKYQKSMGRKCRIPKCLTFWQSSDNILY